LSLDDLGYRPFQDASHGLWILESLTVEGGENRTNHLGVQLSDGREKCNAGFVAHERERVRSLGVTGLSADRPQLLREPSEVNRGTAQVVLERVVLLSEKVECMACTIVCALIRETVNFREPNRCIFVLD